MARACREFSFRVWREKIIMQSKNFLPLLDENTKLDKFGYGTGVSNVRVVNVDSNLAHEESWTLIYRASELVGIIRKCDDNSDHCLWYPRELDDDRIWFFCTLKDAGKRERVELRTAGDRFTGDIRINVDPWDWGNWELTDLIVKI